MGVEQRWQRVGRWAGSLGLAGIVLLFVPIIAISTLGEPPLTASEAEVVAFFDTTSRTAWFEAAEATVVLGSLVLAWALGFVALVLARAEGEPAWRGAMALVSVGIFAAYTVSNVGWQVAGRPGAGMDDGVAHYAFEVNNVAFANVWLALASLCLASGWVTLETGVFPRWTGWLALVAGVGLIVVRYFWAGAFWVFPYALFWVWMIVIFVRLVRGRTGTAAATSGM